MGRAILCVAVVGGMLAAAAPVAGLVLLGGAVSLGAFALVREMKKPVSM